MFDYDRAKQLQKQSHVRGALSKQFYSNDQSQLQKKRRQMKRMLDEQVQQRKKAKQRQKHEHQTKQRKQEEQIKRYYEGAIDRDRRLSDHSSNVINIRNNQSDANSSFQNDSHVKRHIQQSLRQRVNSKTTLQQIDGGNIPLMPIMALSEGQINPNRQNNGMDYSNSDRNHQFYSSFERENAGNIPLLDLSDETNFLKNKKKSKTQIKRQKTERQNNHVSHTIGNSNVKLQESKNNQHQAYLNNNIPVLQNNASVQSVKRKERRRTLSDQQNTSLVHQNLMSSKVSKGSRFQENITIKSPTQTKRNTEMAIPEEIQEMQNQNQILKSELKRSQQAISLLIGAVKSNPKLDKFRIQAEKILHKVDNHQKSLPNQDNKMAEKKEQNTLLLPKLKIKHQSIMHDYLLEAAKKGKIKQIKSQASKY